jgi:hypothetical protein
MRLLPVLIVIAAISAVTPAPAATQKTVVGPGEKETATAVIQKVDAPHRFLVLRGDDGTDVGVFAPPEFTRFNELRVGDHVTITYYRSTVYKLQGRHRQPPAVSEEVSAVENESTLPGATFSHQVVERVTVKAVDRQSGSITVTGPSGQTVVRHVSDLSSLDGVRKGDHVDIVYSEAVLTSVTRAK